MTVNAQEINNANLTNIPANVPANVSADEGKNADIKTQSEGSDNNQENISDDSFAQALRDLSKPQEKETQNPDADKNTDVDKNTGVDKKTDVDGEDNSKKNIDIIESDEELLKSDNDLLKYQTLIKAGYSQDEALEKTYGGFRDYLKTGKTEDIQFQSLTENNVNMSKFSDEEYEMLKQAYANPTDDNLLFHLKRDPELRADLGRNFNIDNLQSLEIYEDAAANNMFRMVLKNSYRNKVGSIIKEIEDAKAVIEQNNKARTDLAAEFENDFFKEFPELNEDNIKSFSLAKHFVDRFRQKTSLLSKEQQQDAEIIRKLYQSAKAEYKKLYPALKKKLGFADAKEIENAQLQQKKLKEMQDKGSSPSGLGGSEKSFMLGNNSSDDDFAAALKELVK